MNGVPYHRTLTNNFLEVFKVALASMAWIMENADKEVCVVAWRQQIAITKAEEVWHAVQAMTKKDTNKIKQV